ncbi:hypothetical protein ACTHR6_01915 [Ralstonia holmesii]|uniref:hypothetical protein n=1 Tax=Ralstonia TaxID=48736 RepID=UPI001268CC07|nr:hypothetical protein [Ralstonia pickettii]
MQRMDTERQVLRINIDGRWEASEFAASFSALDRLYTFRLGLEMEYEELRELRRFYFDTPFPSSMRYMRRWAVAARSSLLHPDRAPLVSAARISAISELLEPDERLVVRRISYASPGIKDLAGIGEIIGHVKDLLLHLIDLWSTRRQRSLENERRELENQQLQVAIAKEFVSFAKELGYSQGEMRQIVALVIREQQPLVRLITKGKITSAESVDGS